MVEDRATGRQRRSPDAAYLDEVTAYLRRLAQLGRGEDVRGRNLLALHVLELAIANDWLGYRPQRDAGRWLIMLLDLAGTRLGMSPGERLQQTLADFLAELRELGLPLLAEVTRSAVAERIARSSGRPVPAAALARLSVAAALWRAGFRVDTYRAQAHFEKHSQGKLIRQKIAAKLDVLWAQAAERLVDGEPSWLHVLAALPPSFDVVLAQVETTLARVDEPLGGAPFAVFYALATDASRSGRRWDPPTPYVDGWAYSRHDFERAVGRSLRGTHSRKARYGRSVSLAELGLSSFFPATVARIDAWLTRCPCSELWVEPPFGVHTGSEGNWLDLARARRARVEHLQRRIHAAVSDAVVVAKRNG